MVYILTSPSQTLTDTLEPASSRTDPVYQQSPYFSPPLSTVEFLAGISLGLNIRVISVWAPLTEISRCHCTTIIHVRADSVLMFT